MHAQALADLVAAGVDGLDAQVGPALAAIPIVAGTSYAMVGDREAALAVGCRGDIEKPIDPNTFVGAVEVHLGKGVQP